VWPLGIEFLHEAIEASLLLQGVEAWRAGCFLLQGQMHTFMAAVLLRMARLDALDADAEAQGRVPPGGVGER
jgi:hypothetical protein